MGFRSTLRAAFRGTTQEAVELNYLNQATSHTDLERRQREIDRGALRPKRFGF